MFYMINNIIIQQNLDYVNKKILILESSKIKYKAYNIENKFQGEGKCKLSNIVCYF